MKQKNKRQVAKNEKRKRQEKDDEIHDHKIGRMLKGYFMIIHEYPCMIGTGIKY